MKRPIIIEGTYRASEQITPETAPPPRREPIFNNWSNAVPLLVIILLRLAFVMGSH